jgi:hypothetical protein
MLSGLGRRGLRVVYEEVSALGVNQTSALGGNIIYSHRIRRVPTNQAVAWFTCQEDTLAHPSRGGCAQRMYR